MSTRRPRIKASANLALASKRKAKTSTDVAKAPQIVSEESVALKVEPIEENVETQVPEEVDNVSENPNFGVHDEQTENSTFVVSNSAAYQPSPRPTEEEAFKYPQSIEYRRTNSGAPIEENTFSDFEDNILHMDLQKSPGFPMSPTKSRQRIRPTPIFGQRRNSFVGTSPSPHTEDETPGVTRQRSSNSTSSDVSNSFQMRKLAAGNLGRIRTESGCSTVSESRSGTRKNPNEEQRKASKREYQNRANVKVLDKSSLKMFDLIYYNPTTNPMEQKPAGAHKTLTDSEAPSDPSSDPPNPSPAESSSRSAMPVPQLKLGSNGEMMIDEKSLEIETTAELEARKVLANSSLIYHDENTGSEGFYRKHKRTRDWLPDETIKFYRCLQTVGTDFSLMLTLFPNRTRRDLKLKFKKEERCNMNLINKALLYPGTFNIEDLKQQLDAEEEERQEQEAMWKQIKAKEAKQTKKVNNAPSFSSRALTSGDEIYQNENITQSKLRSVTRTKNGQTKSKRKKPNPSISFNAGDENAILEKELNDILDPSLTSADTMDSENDFSEKSIELILSELANGTLALVSSVDAANPNKTVYEVYILSKQTGQLSERPLDLPEEIIDAIRSVVS